MSELTDWQKCFAALKPFPTLEDKLIVGLPLLLLTVISIVSNAVLIYYNIAIVMKSKTQANNQVLILVNHFAVANIGYCIVNLVASIPGVLSPTLIYSSDWAMTLTAGFNTPLYLTILLLNFLIAFERFIYFFELFSKSTVTVIRKTLPLIIWVLGVLLWIATEISGCRKVFNQWSMAYGFTCTSCERKTGFQVTMLYNYSGLFGPILLIALYVAVFLQIFKNKWKIGSNSNVSKFSQQEIKVAVNFFVICCFQWFMCTMFFYSRDIFGTGVASPFFINIAGVINGLTQPVALILCNRRARQQLWLRCHRGPITVISNISVTQPHQRLSKERRN